MPAADAKVLKSILRQDFASFLRKAFHTLSPGQVYVPGWHIQAIAHRLQQVHAGEVRRLAINMPPRSLANPAPSSRTNGPDVEKPSFRRQSLAGSAAR